MIFPDTICAIWVTLMIAQLSTLQQLKCIALHCMLCFGYCRRSTGTCTIAHQSLHEVNKYEGKDMKPSQAINQILILSNASFYIIIGLNKSFKAAH